MSRKPRGLIKRSIQARSRSFEQTAAAAFTLVEMLIVVAVVAVLLGLMLPALASMKASSRAVASQSNLRQWGVGTINFCALNKDVLPWEGYKGAADMHLNFAERSWWANSVPPLVGQKPYREISEQATATGQIVPLPPDEQSIFVDPGAHPPIGEQPHVGGAGDPKQFFFCYVPNLQLNNALEPGAVGIDAFPKIKLASIPNSAATILMLEMRTVKSELPSNDPFYNFTLVRARSDWKRLAARHHSGGHVLLADGHVKHVDFVKTTTNNLGTRNPDEPGADWNKPNLIWNPLGPGVEGPGN